MDLHNIWQWVLRSHLTTWIPVKHNLNPQTQNTLSEHNVTHGDVEVVLDWSTRRDHVSVTELHGLGSLGSELTRDDNLATLGPVLHHEAQDTIARSSDGKASEEFVSEGLALSHGAKTTVGDALGIQLDGSFGKVETLLDNRSQLTDTSTLLTQNLKQRREERKRRSISRVSRKKKKKKSEREEKRRGGRGFARFFLFFACASYLLGSGCLDNDFGSEWGDSDVNTGITVLGELSGEQLVKLGVEHSVRHELPLLTDLRRHLVFVFVFVSLSLSLLQKRSARVRSSFFFLPILSSSSSRFFLSFSFFLFLSFSLSLFLSFFFFCFPAAAAPLDFYLNLK